ncbi:hydrogenase maturation nickel metallochaperone HypA [Sulfurospirillum sp. 1307]|jgi:hydrogenase nickel incorporation protein HypA/HybF
MHEFSIVQDLLYMCEKNAKDNNATKITKVEVKIGKLSGVEPHLLQTAFDTFKEKTICDGAEFVMNIQDLVVRCVKCHEKSILEQNVFSCPKCGGDVEVIDGEDMYLMRLEME